MLCACMICMSLCVADMQRHACAMTDCKWCLQRLLSCVHCVSYEMGVLNEVDLPCLCEGIVPVGLFCSMVFLLCVYVFTCVRVGCRIRSTHVRVVDVRLELKCVLIAALTWVALQLCG